MPSYLSPGVYVEEVEAGSRPIEGVGTAVAAFVGFAARGPFNQPTLVTNWSQFTASFGDFLPGSYLGHAVYGYLNNGGGAAYVVRIGQSNGAEPPRAELPAAGKTGVGAYRVVALEAGDGEPLEVSISESPSGGGALKLVVTRGGNVVEEFDDLTAEKGKQNVATVVNASSTQVRIEELELPAGVDARPAVGTVALAAPAAPAPAKVSPEDYVGNSADRTGFGGLEEIDEVTMVSVPDAMAAYQAGLLDSEGLQAVQLALISHCELMGDRMAIVDSPPGLNAQQINEWRMQKAGYDSKFAALYWPWIKVFEPSTGQNVFVPPSGHMGGVWARSDATRGVHKAPANEVVRGAITLETNITKAEHDLLNPNGINCIRTFPGRGIRVWGARTISSDPSWRFINVRRLFNFIEESILEGTQWVVFEPNDQDLWARINRTITGFLLNVWRDGALFGATPEEAFYVKCDAETNPPEAVDAGIVACEIGIAPVKPAEFVVFRISQYSGGAELSE